MSTLSTSIPVSPPSPPLMTAEQFTARYAELRAELVNGIVRELPMPHAKHGKICALMTFILCKHVFEADLGHVMGNDSWIKITSNPDTVLGPDICFFSYERLPRGDVPEGLLSVLPELVIEVRSPSDRWTNVIVKVGQFLQAGVRVVVVLDPGASSVSVYRPDDSPQTLRSGDDLTLPDILPGFSVPVNRLFA